MKRSDNKGFTILELMAIVAIVSILAVLALNAYSDYATRAQVSEGMGFAAEAKSSVLTAYSTGAGIPTSNSLAGLPPPSEYSTDFITSISLGSVPSKGTITVEFSMPPLGTDNLVQLIPNTDSSGRIIWQCRAPATNGIRNVFLPPNCRG
jgi:type IV pilus assembly protein PilA